MSFEFAPSGADNTEAKDVLSTSLAYYRKPIVDNIFNETVTLKLLRSKGRVRMQDGQGSIVVPVEYAKNATVGTFGYYDQINTTPQKVAQLAEFAWAGYAGTATISHKEKRQNAGSNIVNAMELKAKSLSKSMADYINSDLYGATQRTDGIIPLTLLIDATSTIGNINSTSQSFWQSTATTSGSFAAQGLTDMATTFDACSSASGVGNPDIIITYPTVWTYYEMSLQPQVRYMNTNSADGSIMNISYRGASVVWDKACTSNAMYFLNSEAMELVIDSGTDFIMFDPIEPTNQLAQTSKMAVMLQLITTNRRRLGKMTSITA